MRRSSRSSVESDLTESFVAALLCMTASTHHDKGVGMAAGTLGRTRRTSSGDGLLMRLSSETKHSLKTTEFWAMVAIVLGILIASKVIGQGDGNGRANVDAFPAVRAWLYIAIVGVGYMVSRGLAKAGSRDPYWSTGADLPSTRDADQPVSRDR